MSTLDRSLRLSEFQGAEGAEIRFLAAIRLKVTNLDDGASRRSLAGSWIELET